MEMRTMLNTLEIRIENTRRAGARSLSVPVLLAIFLAVVLGLPGMPLAGPPTAVSEVIATSERVIACEGGGTECDFPGCAVIDPVRVEVEGRVQAGSDLFGASYGNPGFSLNDGTGGIFVLTEKNLDLERGDRVRVQGTTHCQFGTLALAGSRVRETSGKGPVVYAPRQVGQLAYPPAIPGNPLVVPNWCNCLNPFSATEGERITVRGTTVADLEQDGSFGFKLFLDDGGGVSQVFIDANSDVPVDKIRDRLLVKGVDLCVTGVVGQFAGVGYELLPRSGRDIRRARPDRDNPCRR
jgi:hypothetical protein